VTEGGPVRIPRGVLEELEAARRAARTEAIDIPTLRYTASEEGRPALVVWLDKHPSDYGRGLLDGFEAED
jgi:hypothetical protein